MTSITTSWERIVSWLHDNTEGVEDLLQPAASSEELEKFARETGVSLPQEFIEFYKVMNGSDPDGESAGIFPSVDEWDEMAFGPLALKQALYEWKMQKELADSGEFADCKPEADDGVALDWWNPAWIPFASNGGGDYYCIDTAPIGTGKPGQIITHFHETGAHKILAPSLSAYLSDLADRLAADKCTYDDTYGLQCEEEEK